MRQTIAYTASAVIHIIAVILLIPASVTPQETVAIELPQQLSLDLQMLAPAPQTKSALTAELQPELQPKQKPRLEPKPQLKPEPKSKPKPIAKVPKSVQAKPPPKKAATPQPAQPVAATATPPADSASASSLTTTVAKQAAAPKQHTEGENQPLIVHNPAYQRRRPVKYPRSAKRKNLQGTVIIRANINPVGRVKKAWVHQSSGHAVLDRSAINSVQKWLFTPAQQGDITIASTVQFPIVFQLQ